MPMGVNITQEGYPFFAGDMTFSGKLDCDGQNECTLNLVGEFLTAIVCVNGVEVPFALDKKKNITNFLRKGENEVSIVLKAGLRNLLGPHHSKEKPFYPGSDPNLFTYRTKWKNGKCKEYTDEYQCISFGLERIEMVLFHSENIKENKV